MKVLVVGGGGREHALCWRLAASPQVSELTCAPGNAGIADVAACVEANVADVAGVVGLARERGIEFVVIGPEAPLAAGLADALEDAGIEAFGPSAGAARIEASKSFARDLCARAGVPSPAWGTFVAPQQAKDYARALGMPLVVKADGLAAGKGVRVCRSLVEVDDAIDALLGGALGRAGSRIVVEEFLRGEEVSVFALVHGPNVLWLADAQDHKRAGEGDTGPNTGGMGAFAPAPCMTAELRDTVMARILRPVARALTDAGCPFRGVLFAGLMVTEGVPRVLEFNARFGDPECQVLMPRLQSDLLALLRAARRGALDGLHVRWSDGAALTVVLATAGYPGHTEPGSVLRGVEAAAHEKGVTVFHAGTVRGDDGALHAAGGRVLSVTAVGADLAAARRRAYDAVGRIDWPQGFYRRDIGWRAVAGGR